MYGPAISPFWKLITHWFEFPSDYKCRTRKLDLFDTVVFGSDHSERSWSSTFRNFDSTLFRTSCSQLRRYVDNRFLIVQQRPPSDLRFSSLYTDLDFSGSPVELELGFPCILMVHRAQKSCSFNSILVVTNPNFLHELAPLHVQTGFPSSDIDMSRHCDFSIVQACSALIWILR